MYISELRCYGPASTDVIIQKKEASTDVSLINCEAIRASEEVAINLASKYIWILYMLHNLFFLSNT